MTTVNRIVKYKQGHIGAYSGSVLKGSEDLAARGVGAVAGICTDASGNVFVSDCVNHVILKVEKDGTLHIYAGTLGTWGTNGDTVVSAYNAKFNDPVGLACDLSGNVYVADSGNNQIRRIGTDRRVSLVAGDAAGASGFVSGEAIAAARLNAPQDVAVDPSGRIYIADTGNHAVRMLLGANIYTVAGTGTAGDTVGTATSAQINAPYGVACDRSDRVYIADTGSYKLKILNLANNQLTRFSGAGLLGFRLGNQDVASFQTLKFMDIDKSGNLYVVSFDDDLDSRILKINSNGFVSLIASYTTSPDQLRGVAVDNSGFIYVTESEKVELESSSSSEESGKTSSSSSSSSNSSSSSSSVSSESSSSESSESSRTESSSSRTESSESSSESSRTESSESSSSSLSSRTESSSESSESSNSSSISSSSRTESSESSSSSSGVEITLAEQQQYDILVPDGNYRFTYTGEADTNAWINLAGVFFKVGDVGSSFVWDIDGAGEHTFATVSETISRNSGSYAFNVVWNGDSNFSIYITNTALSSSSSDSSESSSSSS